MTKIIVGLLCFFISGCSLFNKTETVAIAPHYERLEHDTFAILPFVLGKKGLNKVKELGKKGIKKTKKFGERAMKAIDEFFE